MPLSKFAIKALKKPAAKHSSYSAVLRRPAKTLAKKVLKKATKRPAVQTAKKATQASHTRAVSPSKTTTKVSRFSGGNAKGGVVKPLCFGASLNNDPTPTSKNVAKDKINTFEKAKASAVIIWLHDYGKEPASCQNIGCLDLNRSAQRKKKGDDDDDSEMEEDDDEDADDKQKFGPVIKTGKPEDTDFGKELAHVRWFLPEADRVNVDLKMDGQEGERRFWFNIKELPIADNQSGEGKSRDAEPKFLASSTKKIHSFIDRYVKLGIPAERIVLGGFGQGGAMAAVAALRYKKRLGGVVVQNGWLPLCAEEDLKRSGSKMPFFVSHGDFDQSIHQSVKERTTLLLEKHGYPMSLVTAWFLNHSDALLIRRRVLEFLCDVLPKSGGSLHQPSSFKFDEPDDMTKVISDFSLDRYSQIRGLV
jgi:predicted esterase